MPNNRTTVRKKSSTRPARTTDAVTLLKKDHETVRGLLSKLKSTSDRNSSGRTKLLSQIESEVKVHTQIEEEIFYPAFRRAVRSKDDKELYFEAVEEHHVVDMYMPEIKGTRVDDET